MSKTDAVIDLWVGINGGFITVDEYYEMLNLLNLNNFTDTDPAFRANLKIYNFKGGFSSYQSDYPYEMIVKKGNILSGLRFLTNKDSKNIIFFNYK